MSLNEVFRTSTVDVNKLVPETSRSVVFANVFIRAGKSLICDKADLASAETESKDWFKLSTFDDMSAISRS